MARKVLSGLIQASNPINDESKSVAEIQAAMLEKHLPMIHDAGKKGVQILCLQEIFNGPYFCPGQDKRWYDAAEAVPGPTVEKLAPIAAQYKMAMVVPLVLDEVVRYEAVKIDPARGCTCRCQQSSGHIQIPPQRAVVFLCSAFTLRIGADGKAPDPVAMSDAVDFADSFVHRVHGPGLWGSR